MDGHDPYKQFCVGLLYKQRLISVSSIQHMRPLDPEDPCSFFITFEKPGLGTQEISFHVDTEQSAVQWRRSLEGAFFRQARRRFRENLFKTNNKTDKQEHPGDDEWSTMRCCVPLDRVQITGISDYHSFALLVKLEISLDGEKISWRPEDFAAGDYTGRLVDSPGNTERIRHSLRDSLPFLGSRSQPGSRDSSPSRKSSMTYHKASERPPSAHTGPSTPKRGETHYIDTVLPRQFFSGSRRDTAHDNDSLSNSYALQLAVLNEQAWFAKALQSAVAAASERKYRPGVKRHRMNLEIAGCDCLATDDELEALATRTSESSDEHEHDHGAITQAMRKAEKAALAAKVFGLKDEDGVYSKSGRGDTS